MSANITADRVSRCAMEHGIQLRPLSLAWATSQVQQRIGDSKATDEDIAEHLMKARQETPSQFLPMQSTYGNKPETAEQRLERGNALIAAERAKQTEARPGGIAVEPLSQARREWLQSLPATLRTDYGNNALEIPASVLRAEREENQSKKDTQ